MIPTKFPSLAWFRTLQERMNAQPEKYRRIGCSDLRMTVCITPSHGHRTERSFGLVFAESGCAEVSADPDAVAFDPDFTIEGPIDAWAEMVANIEARGRADTAHTLNTLTLLDKPLCVVAEDQSRADLFARHNYTLQEFFNEAGAKEPAGLAPAQPAV